MSNRPWREIQKTRTARTARQRAQTRLRLGIVGLVALSVMGYYGWSAFQKTSLAAKAVWQDLPDQGQSHISEDTIFDEYNSDPPTSGPHYSEPTKAGFYEEPIEDGHLIHSLEHGYVIIWYDCERLLDDACGRLKTQIEELMQDEGSWKLIAVPRNGMEGLIALTAWTKLDRLDSFNEIRIKAFIAAFRGKGPEPNAP